MMVHLHLLVFCADKHNPLCEYFESYIKVGNFSMFKVLPKQLNLYQEQKFAKMRA